MSALNQRGTIHLPDPTKHIIRWDIPPSMVREEQPSVSSDVCSKLQQNQPTRFFPGILGGVGDPPVTRYRKIGCTALCSSIFKVLVDFCRVLGHEGGSN